MIAAVSIISCLQGAPPGEILVRKWGENAIRVQIAPSSADIRDDLPNAYLPGGPINSHGFFSYGPKIEDVRASPVVSGNIKAAYGPGGLVVSRISDGKQLLTECGRQFSPSQANSICFSFKNSATKLYGLGQNRHQNNGGGLGVNVINETYSFQSSIGEEGGPSNSLPWVMGADPAAGGYQFGVLFNSPSLGGVSFSNENMTWSIVADAGNQFLRKQFDFLITTHDKDARAQDKPFQIIEKYLDAVGHARKQPFPGYWHSKNRYASQDELLAVARGFHNRSIPVDVLVIDWFHWKIMGDWSFDESKWPDPKAMVDECKSYGMEIMVSVWAFTCPGSRSYATLTKNNWVTTYVGADGKRSNLPIETHGKNCRLVDPTLAATRKYVWSLIETGYFQYGIKIFWLDASEPEGFGPLSVNASWSAGNMRDMGSMFTLYWTQAFYDGLLSHDESEIVMLPRAGWVGTWRHGAVLWSGDIGSDMPTLRSQVNIGLSAQTSGIPWWTTDIGGYHGGNAEDPKYRETIVRWFQYGFTNPMFRQHGARDHTAPWYYGPEDEKIIVSLIKLRASMKGYFSGELDKLNATGRPFNRLLTWDFPDDPRVWELAENGIGDAKSSFQPSDVIDGTWVTLSTCQKDMWAQQWALTQGSLAVQSLPKFCVDNGGQPGGTPPQGPFQVHMWGCSKTWASSQTWAFEGSTVIDPIKHICLTSGDGVHPSVAVCDNTTSNQQWKTPKPGTSGAIVANGKCLTITGPERQGVADQYMVGDEYMAAPILNLGQTERPVYFPCGTDWQHHFTGQIYKGCSTATVPAPLDSFPFFKRLH